MPAFFVLSSWHFAVANNFALTFAVRNHSLQMEFKQEVGNVEYRRS